MQQIAQGSVFGGCYSGNPTYLILTCTLQSRGVLTYMLYRVVLTVGSYPCREIRSLCLVYLDQVIGTWFTTYNRVQVGIPGGYTISSVSAIPYFIQVIWWGCGHEGRTPPPQPPFYSFFPFFKLLGGCVPKLFFLRTLGRINRARRITTPALP